MSQNSSSDPTNLISSLTQTLSQFQSDNSLKNLHASLSHIQSQIKPYFLARQPLKVINEDAKRLKEALQNSAAVSSDDSGAASSLGIIEDLELVYHPDIWRNKTHHVTHLVVEYLLREGMQNEAEMLIKESGLRVSEDMKTQFRGMWGILQELKRGDTNAALQWCDDELNDDLMEDDAPKDKKIREQLENLKFRLHRMRYVQLLMEHGEDQDATKVVQYARQHLAPFSKKPAYMDDISMLMGALLYANDLRNSPYAHLADIHSSDEWDEIILLFKSIACGKLEKPQHSPLYTATLAGASALPVLLKQANVIKSTMSREEWEKFQQADQLTVRVPLDEEFHFHNIFTCPVSHEIATPDNPPVLLPCGHVLCKNSVDRIAPTRGANRCKCPYCRSTEFLKSTCQELHFG